MINNETGLAVMNVDQVVRLLSSSYVKLIRNQTPFADFPAVMLWGPPGIGKSQSVRQIAEIIREDTQKQVAITDVRLLLFNPVDLRGIPTANEDKTLAIWLKPKIFQMDASADTVNILLLDEITAAPQSVQAAAYQITLDRMIGEHRLPENCIILVAGNRVTDKSVAYHMPRALANRLLHIEIQGDAAMWHDWAVQQGVHKYVTSYLSYSPTALLRSDAPEANLAFPTPRSWEMASNILNNISEDFSAVEPLIAGCIGTQAAYPFKKWCSLFSQLPPVDRVFQGKKVTLRNEVEIQEAFRSEMVAYARQHPEKEMIDRSIDFALTQPWSFRTNLLHDYRCIPVLQPILEANEVYRSALKDGLK